MVVGCNRFFWCRLLGLVGCLLRSRVILRLDQFCNVSHVDQTADLALVETIKNADLHDFLRFYLVLVRLFDLKAEGCLARPLIIARETATLITLFPYLSLIFLDEVLKDDLAKANKFWRFIRFLRAFKI